MNAWINKGDKHGSFYNPCFLPLRSLLSVALPFQPKMKRRVTPGQRCRMRSATMIATAGMRLSSITVRKTAGMVSGTCSLWMRMGMSLLRPTTDLIGRDPALRVDASGYFYGDDLMSATEAGKWISYIFRHPQTGENARKHTWVVRHDGLLFASGFYEGE